MIEKKPKSTQRAVGIVIKDQKILLLHRIKDGREYYVFPGGSVEGGETLQEAAARELKEELSIDIEIKEKPIFEVYVAPSEYDWGRTSYFFWVTNFSGNPSLGGPEKERMNEDNQYYPFWLDIDKIENTENLYPEEAREKLLKYLDI